MPSGVVFVAILVIWAVILAPRAMRLYERTATQRTTRRFSSAMSVLGTGRSVSRVSVDTARRGARVVVDTREPGVSALQPMSTQPSTQVAGQPGASLRRRRRVVAACAGLLAAVVTASLAGLLPWSAVLLASLPLVLFLGACAAMSGKRRRANSGGRSATNHMGSAHPETKAVASSVVALSGRRARRSGLRAGGWTQARVLEADLAIAATYESPEEQLGLDRYVASPSDIDGEPYLRAANE